MNYAPRFVSNPKSVHTWAINDDKNEQKLTFGFELPDISDDKKELEEVHVESKNFGEAKWLNGSGIIPV